MLKLKTVAAAYFYRIFVSLLNRKLRRNSGNK